MAYDTRDEVILAEEQGVINRGTGLREEIAAGFDSGKETEGTLLLTNRRLIYIVGAQNEDSLPVGAFSTKKIYYADVEDLGSVSNSINLSIPLDGIVSAEGHSRFGASPKLILKWNDGAVMRTTEFVEQVTGGSRRRNLNDWAKIIQRLKSGELRLVRLPPTPSRDTLEGKIASVLGDMQEKGPFMIEDEIEKRFGIDAEVDQVQEACEKLVVCETKEGYYPFRR